MCYVNRKCWKLCGHYRVEREMCEAARRREPPAWCIAAHEPIMTDIPAEQGLCPDKEKHPPSTNSDGQLTNGDTSSS